MAVLKREDFFSRLNDRLGSDTSEEGITFLEDMTDTFNDLEKRANGDGVNWEEKYHQLDADWRKKYQHRFFSGGSINIPDTPDDEDDEEKVKNIGIKDLFTDK